MKMKILALIAVALTAGGMWGLAQQPLVQTAQTYPWRACPWWNGSRAAYGNYDPTTGTWYHSYHGRVYHYSNYGCCY
jgi:hypothetical protein